MARTMNPNDVLDAFKQEVVDAQARHTTIQTALNHLCPPESCPTGTPCKPSKTVAKVQAKLPKATQAATLGVRKGATTDFIFRLGGEFELFQHKWHIACISNDPSVFVQRLNTNLTAALTALTGKHRHVTGLSTSQAAYPRRPTVAQIEDLLDREGRNITFTDVAEWKKETGRDLHSKHARKVAQLVQRPDDTFVLELLKAARNAIAHQSGSSIKIFNECVMTLTPRAPAIATSGPTTAVPTVSVPATGANAGLSRVGTNKVQNVATYLHMSKGTGPRRCDILATRLLDVVETLRLP